MFCSHLTLSSLTNLCFTDRIYVPCNVHWGGSHHCIFWIHFPNDHSITSMYKICTVNHDASHRPYFSPPRERLSFCFELKIEVCRRTVSSAHLDFVYLQYLHKAHWQNGTCTVSNSIKSPKLWSLSRVNWCLLWLDDSQMMGNICGGSSASVFVQSVMVNVPVPLESSTWDCLAPGAAVYSLVPPLESLV